MTLNRLFVHAANEIQSLIMYKFASYDEFQHHYHMSGMGNIITWIDEKYCTTRHPFEILAYCTVCNEPSKMKISYNSMRNGSAVPWWTEQVICSLCGFNNRTRALDLMLKTSQGFTSDDSCYIAEQTTKWAESIKNFIPNAIFSEYVSPDALSGNSYPVTCGGGSATVRHEDLTALSFPDNRLACIVTRDIFEHIPNYQAAFREVFRCLKPSGSLLYTVPFNGALQKTVVRARLINGSIEHILPPEVHGNPMSKEGSLCFQNFGWDILDCLRDLGFSDAHAYLYWSPIHGHIGNPCFVFKAIK